MAGNKIERFAKLGAFVLNASSDDPDIRDFLYPPSMAPVPRILLDPDNLRIMDQCGEGCNVAFALSAVINRMCEIRGQEFIASPRMLEQMAYKFSEQRLAESPSCRDAIRGWAGNGVCADKYWPYIPGKPGSFSIEAAKSARMISPAAYYRVPNILADMQSALNEAGAIFCSATVHKGWETPGKDTGLIALSDQALGGHAFAIVGYDDMGFLIQNSWSKAWGMNGLARWSYEDWNLNVSDAWVFRLNPPSSISITAVGSISRIQPGHREYAVPWRSMVSGHFANFSDGKFNETGTFWSNLEDVRQTAKFLRASEHYDHLLLYVHGGVYEQKVAMERAAATDQIYKANRIYPFHLILDARIAEELQHLIERQDTHLRERVGNIPHGWDPIVEENLRAPGRALWREIRRGAHSAFAPGGAGRAMLDVFLDIIQSDRETPLSLHLAGFDSGAIALAYLLEAMEDLSPTVRVHSVSLLGASVVPELFRTHYLPLLEAPLDSIGIDKLTLYNLDDDLERSDSIGPYRKSFLYLVSRALEEESNVPLVGMQRGLDPIIRQHETLKDKESKARLIAHTSDGKLRSRAKTHNSLETDAYILNSILWDILGREPTVKFTSTSIRSI